MATPESVAELYLELTLKDEQLNASIAKAEQSLGKLEQAGQKAGKGLGTVEQASGSLSKELKTGLAVGAAGFAAAALGLVATRALEVATNMDRATRQISAGSVALRGNLESIRDTIRGVSAETGRSVEEIAAVGEAISRQGVTGLDDFTRRLRTASDLALATGQDFEATANGLNQVLQVFGLASTDIDKVAGSVFALTERGADLNEVFQALQYAAPGIRDVGIDFETAAKALATLLNQGLNSRQAAQELRALGKEGSAGAEQIRLLAEQFPASADGARDLSAALDEVNGSAARASEVIKSKLSVQLDKLGANLLPIKRAAQAVTGALVDGIAKYIELVNKAVEVDRKVLGLGGGTVNPAAGTGSTILTNRGALQPATPSGPAPKTAAQLAAEAAAADKAAREAQRNADAAQRALDNLQDTVNALGQEVFPKAITAVASYQEKLADLIPTLEKGNAAQRARAELLKAEGEQLAKLADLLQKSGVADYTAKTQITTASDADVRGVDYAKQNVALTVEQNRVNEQGAEAQDKADKEHLDALIEQGRRIRDAVDGALQLAEAFGLVDATLSKILDGIAGVATGIGPLSAALKSGSTGDIIGTALPVAGGLASVISGIGDLLGESPELKAARAAIEQNVQALKDNTLELRRVNLTGSDVSQGGAGLRNFLNQDLSKLQNQAAYYPKLLSDALDQAGVSMDDLRRYAKELGLEFVDLTNATVPQFIQFLQQVGDRLDELSSTPLFGTDFTGRQDRARNDITFSPQTETAGETIAKIFGAAIDSAESSPLIKAAFGRFLSNNVIAGLDSPDPEVRNRAIEAARNIVGDLYDQISAEGFDPALLGDATPQQILDFLNGVLGTLPDIVDTTATDLNDAAIRFSDSMQKISDAARVFDYSNAETAGQILGAMADSFPAFADAIAGFDLSTVDGIQAAINAAQQFFLAVENGSISLEGAGFTLGDLVNVIDLLQGAADDAANEVQRLAEQERQRLEQARREYDQAVADEQRRRDEEARAAEQAHQEALRQIEEERRARQALGSDTLRALHETFQLFDITDTTKQLQQLFAVLESQSSVFTGLLGGLDAGSATDRAVALQRLKDFQLQNPFGVDSGNLSAEEVRRQVLTVAAAIKQLNLVDVTTTDPTGTVGSFSINRTITEARGEQMVGLLGTANLFAERTAIAVEGILASLSSGGGISPPGISTTGAIGVAIGVANIVINVDGATVATGTVGGASVTDLITAIVSQTNLRALGAG